MYFLYIIKGQRDNGIYIGITNNITKHLEGHNQGKTKSTKSRIPFVLVYYEAYKSKVDCRKHELGLKKAVSKGEF